MGHWQQIGKFNTGGTAFANTTQRLGPDDSDQEVIASSDGRFALCRQSRGATRSPCLASVTTGRCGAWEPLTPAACSRSAWGLPAIICTSPTAVMRFQGQTATVAPNTRRFNVGEHGALSPIAGSTITLPIGLSPGPQTLVPRMGDLCLAITSPIPGTHRRAWRKTIDPFAINADGTLQQAPGGAVGAAFSPECAAWLGGSPDATDHLWRTLTGAGRDRRVFTYDQQGICLLFFQLGCRPGGPGPCWIVVSADGRFLYASNTGNRFRLACFRLGRSAAPGAGAGVQPGRGPFAPPESLAGRQPVLNSAASIHRQEPLRADAGTRHRRGISRKAMRCMRCRSR